MFFNFIERKLPENALFTIYFTHFQTTFTSKYRKRVFGKSVPSDWLLFILYHFKNLDLWRILTGAHITGAYTSRQKLDFFSDMGCFYRRYKNVCCPRFARIFFLRIFFFKKKHLSIITVMLRQINLFQLSTIKFPTIILSKNVIFIV